MGNEVSTPEPSAPPPSVPADPRIVKRFRELAALDEPTDTISRDVIVKVEFTSSSSHCT